MSNPERQKRDDYKKEYLRGLEEAKELHKGCNHAFLGIVRDRLTTVLNDVTDMEEAEEEIEKVIQLIDEYTDGQVTAKELREREESDDDVEDTEGEIDGLGGDDVISIMDFVRDDH